MGRRHSLVGSNIVTARQLARVTQQQLAQRLEVSQSRISDWERGIHHPNRDTLARIADALGYPPSWFHQDHADLRSIAIGPSLDGAAIVATSADFTLTAWNEGAQRLLGWSAEEALGQCVFDLLPARDSEKLRAERRHALRERGWWRGFAVVGAKGGGTVRFEVAAFVVHDGPLMQYVCVFRSPAEE